MLKRLNQVEAFEFTFPFYRMRIDQFEGRVKRYVNIEDNGTVSMRQLVYSFSEDEPWNPRSDETSILCHLMNEPELRDDDQPDKLNVIKLICLGLTLCGGEPDMKARVFYDVLQDNM